MNRRRAVAALTLIGFLAAALWPLTNFLAINYSQVAVGAYGRPIDIFLVSFGAVVVGLTTAFVASRLKSKAGPRVLTVFAVGIFALFSSVALRDLLRSAGLTDLTTVLAGAIILAILLLVWVVSKAEPVRVLVSLASIFAFAMAFAALAPQLMLHGHSSGAQPVSDARRHSLSGENVYLIVLDEYAGAQTLLEMGFDNRPFIDEMTKRGFLYDSHAKSNYISTHASIMAILEGDYPVTESSPRYVDRSAFYPAAINNGYEPRLVAELASSGYATKRISNWWAGCSTEVFDTCVVSPSTQSYALRTFLAPTLVGSLTDSFRAETATVRDAALELFVDQFWQLKQDEPYLLLIHHLSPHLPYSRNADCSARNGSDAEETLPVAERVRLYLAALRCVNSEVLRAVDLIEREDPDGLVVILSDHGSEFQVDWNAPLDAWSEDALSERLDILSLVKLPSVCKAWAREGMGQVNVVRFALACLERTPPDLLPEHSYITAYEYHPDFGLVARMR